MKSDIIPSWPDFRLRNTTNEGGITREACTIIATDVNNSRFFIKTKHYPDQKNLLRDHVEFFREFIKGAVKAQNP